MDIDAQHYWEFEQTFINVKMFGTPEGYEVVAAIVAPTSLGADVTRLRIREVGSGQIAGRVVDRASRFWPSYESYMPPEYHLVQASLSEFSTFERDAQGVLRTPRDLVFDIVDSFGQPIGAGLYFTWYAARTLPMPGRENIVRVAGGVGPDGFLFGGAMWHARLEHLIRQYVGRSSSTLDRILDWGVGCGRIARHFLERGHRNLYGADIDSMNIEWLHDNFGWDGAVRVDFDPPMPYPDGHFDVVYGSSVFTHLSEKDHVSWLMEIARVLKPGGFAFLTVCTEPGVYITHYKEMTRSGEFLRRYLESGFFDFEAQNVGVDAGRAGYYRRVAHTRSFILRNWSRHFIIRRILPCYMEHQDLVILQNPN
jgi:SAM-dependent methyltransferase